MKVKWGKEAINALMTYRGDAYLDTLTGDIIKRKGVFDENNQFIVDAYDVNIEDDRYLKLPTFYPYLHYLYLKKQGYSLYTLTNYGLTGKEEIEKYAYCRNACDEFFYDMYVQQVHELFEGTLGDNGKNVEAGFRIYMKEKEEEMAREWYIKQGITLDDN